VPVDAVAEIPCFTLEEIRASNAGGDQSLCERIDAAFGPDGPGVLCITGEEVKERVRTIRAHLLPRVVELTELPVAVRSRLHDPDTPLTNGLSRGSEVTDRAKSSFYFHPVTDTPARHLPPGVERLTVFHNPNLFPSEEELPGFKGAVRDAAQYVVKVGHELALVIDRRLELVPGYARGRLSEVVRTGPDSNHKCRLIRYHAYETPEEVAATRGMWAAPHLDTGSLTGLVPGIFVNPQGQPTDSPDTGTGLFIVDRRGTPHKAQVPAGVGEALFFQIGESLQIISGGELQATPHYVKGPRTPDPSGVSRCALAVFMQPHPHEELPIPSGLTYPAVAARSADRHLPPEWPSLEWRFRKLGLEPGQVLTFGQHSNVTFSNLGSNREQ